MFVLCSAVSEVIQFVAACKGSRLRREALQVKIAGKSIHDVVSIPIEHSLKFFESALAEKLSEYDLLVGERILK